MAQLNKVCWKQKCEMCKKWFINKNSCRTCCYKCKKYENVKSGYVKDSLRDV